MGKGNWGRRGMQLVVWVVVAVVGCWVLAGLDIWRLRQALHFFFLVSESQGGSFLDIASDQALRRIFQSAFLKT